MKLLDFGIARLLTSADDDPEASTQPVTRVLTLEYASPEQVRGEPVTIASDVYQLGLLLYELLAGVKAQVLSDAGPATLEEAICEHPPARPSARVLGSPAIAAARGVSPGALVRKLSGDLDTIVLCALRKEPDRRYPSVEELSADLQRFRTGRPVRAQVDSVAYRTRKFVSRHRAALFWATALLAIAVATLPAVVSERLRTAREAARAEQVEQLLAAMFAFATPRAAQAPTATHYVDHANELVQTELAAEPRSQARLLLVLGQVYNALGQYRRVDSCPRPVTGAAANDLRREQPRGRAGAPLAGSQRTLCGPLRSGGSQLPRARWGFSGPRPVPRVRTRSARWSSSAICCIVKGGCSRPSRFFAMPSIRRALPGRRPLAAIRPAKPCRGPSCISRTSCADRGIFDESAALFHTALDALPPVRWRAQSAVRITRSYLARLHVMRGDFREAERLLTHALGVLRVAYGDTHPLVATALREYGYLRIEQGRFAEAESMLEEAERILLRSVGAAHSLVARNRAHLAELALRRGRPGAAVQLARDTLGDFDRLGIPDHPSAIDARATLGQALLATGNRDAARELGRGLASAERQFVAGDARTARLRDANARAATGAR